MKTWRERDAENIRDKLLTHVRVGNWKIHHMLNNLHIDEIYMENTTGKHNKWWYVQKAGPLVSTAWGQIGKEGDLKNHLMETNELAAAYFKKKVKEKYSKGYVFTQINAS